LSPGGFEIVLYQRIRLRPPAKGYPSPSPVVTTGFTVSTALVPPADFCYPPGTISVDEARSFILARARPGGRVDTVALDDALGRIVAEPLLSPIDVPGHDNSQMDGYAMRGQDVPADGAWLSVSQRIPAGRPATVLVPETAARIFTGAPMPPGADCVVMQERCRVEGDKVWVPGGLKPGDNVRPRGNDLVAGQVVLEQGERLYPQHLGLAASLGLAELRTAAPLKVAIFSSGDELRLPGEPLEAGQIYNSNRYTLHALLRRAGCVPMDLGRVADSLEATVEILREAAGQADVIVSSGGVSVGEEDHVKAALERVGEISLWRVAVRPGKPLAFGRVGDADFLGLPGNPVSVFVTFCLFVRPFLLMRMGARDLDPPFTPVRAGFDRAQAAARRDFARARIQGAGHDVPEAVLHPRQGSDVLSSAVWADGLVEIPEGVAVTRGDLLRYVSFDSLMS
jgi:molybdopterin molybdotransferase